MWLNKRNSYLLTGLIKIYRELYLFLRLFLSNENLKTTGPFFIGMLNILNHDPVNPGKVKKLPETLEEKQKHSPFFYRRFYSYFLERLLLGDPHREYRGDRFQIYSVSRNDLPGGSILRVFFKNSFQKPNGGVI